MSLPVTQSNDRIQPSLCPIITCPEPLISITSGLPWGKNDPIFPAAGAYPYKRDLKNLEFHLLDTGHFALEEDGATIAPLIRNFLGKHLSPSK